ncbi:lysine--tRNA ligase [archaeon]|nr:lysine--tRNA ligase [archaeon]
MEKNIEHYTWIDGIVNELKARNAKKHVIHGMWTPSGYFHIGNARSELMTPMLVFSTAKEAGLSADFNFFVDDFDDLDKIPGGIDVNKEEFSEYLGKPLYEVPSPVAGYKSWSDYFAHDIKDVAEKFGTRPDWHSSYESYRKGLYDDAIRIVLDNSKTARNIMVRVAKAQKPDDWIPIMVVCENCGRSATTTAIEWTGDVVKYKCFQDREYAKSCGHCGEVKPEKGRVKLPWRLHWPATWFAFGTTFESAGKDHFASGGSVETGHAFMREIFKTEPPYQVGVEFVQIDGKKISGSVGNVISLPDWLEFAEPEIMRFLYVSYQPSTAIEFSLQSNKFFLLTDRYDEAERCYYGSQSLTEKRTEQLKRQYELAQIRQPGKQPVQFSYSTAAMIVQAVPNKSISNIEKILKTMGVTKELTEYDRKRISLRIELMEKWLSKYAPEEIKIKINQTAPVPVVSALSEDEKSAVGDVKKALEKNISESELQSEIYEIARSHNVEPKKFFQILYRILITKDYGPKLGPFMIALGKDRVKSVLNSVE